MMLFSATPSYCTRTPLASVFTENSLRSTTVQSRRAVLCVHVVQVQKRKGVELEDMLQLPIPYVGILYCHALMSYGNKKVDSGCMDLMTECF